MPESTLLSEEERFLLLERLQYLDQMLQGLGEKVRHAFC